MKNEPDSESPSDVVHVVFCQIFSGRIAWARRFVAAQGGFAGRSPCVQQENCPACLCFGGEPHASLRP